MASRRAYVAHSRMQRVLARAYGGGGLARLDRVTPSRLCMKQQQLLTNPAAKQRPRARASFVDARARSMGRDS